MAKVSEAIREGETIAKPMANNSAPRLSSRSPRSSGSCPARSCPLIIMSMPGMIEQIGVHAALGGAVGGGVVGCAWYLLKMNARVVDDLVVNMVDVGEETGELDTMLYKVADIYDEEVSTLTDGLMKLIEPLLIVFLGGAVGFIVIALFLPLISLIQGLS